MQGVTNQFNVKRLLWCCTFTQKYAGEVRVRSILPDTGIISQSIRDLQCNSSVKMSYYYKFSLCFSGHVLIILLKTDCVCSSSTF